MKEIIKGKGGCCAKCKKLMYCLEKCYKLSFSQHKKTCVNFCNMDDSQRYFVMIIEDTSLVKVILLLL